MNKTTPKFGPVETDVELDRKYIPLPGGWEVQTKGKGSTFRICGPDGHRMVVPEYPYFHDFIERMALDANKAHEEAVACAVMLRSALIGIVGSGDTEELESMLDALQIIGPSEAGDDLARARAAILAIISSQELCHV